MVARPLARRRNGSTDWRNITFISEGTPGRQKNRHRPRRTANPAAVPVGFGITSLPRGTYAWPKLEAGGTAPPGREQFPNVARALRVLDELRRARCREALAGGVVAGRSQTAGRHGQVGPRGDFLDRRPDVRPHVADGGVAADGEAEQRELLGEKRSVGVRDAPGHQLAADGEDFHLHRHRPFGDVLAMNRLRRSPCVLTSRL